MWHMTWPSNAYHVRREPSLGVAGGLHTVSQGWYWDYLDAVLLIHEGG